MKTIICEKEQAFSRAAAMVADCLRKKPDAVLALACGKTMEEFWPVLTDLYRRGELSFQKARIFQVTELIGVPEEKSCRHALKSGLLEQVDLPAENCFFPDADDPADYDKRMEAMGGIDLAVLGIGEDCHIGYNEPGTLFDSCTHVQKLTDRTKRQLRKRGFTEENMPQQAVTMGIKTLTEAKEILVLAVGGDKAGAVYQMVYAKTTPYIPAAYLQIPLEVTAIFDREAAGEL